MTGMVNDWDGVRLSVSIMHHVQRRDMLRDLVMDLIREGVAHTVVVNDADPPGWAGLAECWERATIPREGATHHLVLQDDCRLPIGFGPALRSIMHQQGAQALSLYTGVEAAKTAFDHGFRYLVTPIATVAVVLPVGVWRAFREWAQCAFRPLAECPTYRDWWRLTLFLAEHGRATWHPLPCLVEHVGSACSLLWPVPVMARAAVWRDRVDLWPQDAQVRHGGGVSVQYLRELLRGELREATP